MRSEQIKAYLSNSLFAVCPSYLQSIIDVVNSGEIKRETNNEVTPSHSYEVVGNTAIISIDGVMTKINTSFNAMCGGFVAYDTINSYMDKAENDESVKTILFNVDTPGGDVAGADEIGERIFNSPKKTITYFNNIGASAGMWIFTASDEIYANKTVILGSVGVMSTYYDEKQEDGKVILVSKNAENKNCKLDGTCKQKIQKRIDDTESIFFERLERNTAMSKDELIAQFNNGDVINSNKALEIGFLDGIKSFHELKTLVAGAVPTSNNSNKPANLTKGNEMAENMSNEEIEASVPYQNLFAEVNILQEQLKALQDERDDLKAKLSTTTTIVAQAYEMNVGKDVAIKMVESADENVANKLCLEAIKTQGATVQAQDAVNVDNENTQAWARVKKMEI